MALAVATGAPGPVDKVSRQGVADPDVFDARR
jgi:hypothetical protein